MEFETSVVHGGQFPDAVCGAIAPPIVTSKNGAFRSLGDPIGIEYARGQNPTREALQRLVAQLEGGGECFAFSSGVAAINCFFSTLDAGDHVVFSSKLYGGSIRLAEKLLSKFLKIDYADATDIEQLRRAVKPGITKCIFVETPTNPLLEIVDLEGLRDLSADTGVPFVLDNTVATPALIKGFDFGARAVIHSTSKYLGGHNDLLGGVVTTKDAELAEKLRLYSKTIGSTPGPLEAYQTIRGIKTLSLRMKKHCENARKIALFLEGKAGKVFYPGMADHPQHDLAREQMKDFGGVVSFEVDNYREFANAVAAQVHPIYLAESMGGVESLLAHPATMSHAYLGARGRERVGIKDELLRLSCGIEDANDIIACLENAFEAAKGKEKKTGNARITSGFLTA